MSLLLAKTMRVMKLTALLLITGCLAATAKGVSQITLSEKNSSLEKVIKKIKKQSGYHFLTTYELLQQVGTVNVNLKNVSVKEAITECLKDKPLTFEIIDKTVILKAKPVVAIAGITITVPAFEEILPPPPGIDVHGTITDSKGNPVAGATVQVKGTGKMTVTNDLGEFTLTGVDEKAVLLISAVNIENLEVPVNHRKNLTLTAKIKISQLDEVQLIGYGKTTKRFNTGAVSTVKSDVIQAQPVTNIFQGLQGQMAGVSVTQSTGVIGAGSTMIIRGVNSLQSGTDPLIIVDGVIINNAQNGLTNGSPSNLLSGMSPLNSINPGDIESVDILKDADATSIYGSRGTNGVVLITTKKGKTGQTKFNLNLYSGQNSASYLTPRLNTQQYLQFRKDAFAMGNYYTDASGAHAVNPIAYTSANAPDLTTWSQTANTNWQKWELGNVAPLYNVDANISGGSKLLNFYASAAYFKQYDIQFNKPYQERLSSHLNLHYTSEDNKLNIDFTTNFSVENAKLTETSLGSILPIFSRNPPNYQMYNSDGSLNLNTGAIAGAYFSNPVPVESVSNKSKTYNTLLSSDISYVLLKGLTARFQASFNSQNNQLHQIIPSAFFPVNGTNPQSPNTAVTTGTHTTNQYMSINLEPRLEYTAKIYKGRLSAMAGSTFLNKQTNSTSVVVTNTATDALLSSWSSSNPAATVSNNTVYYKFNSVFGKLNYNWDNKYIANINYRVDGSSRFGEANLFANFWSGGLAWLFGSEKFVQKALPFLSHGKLRTSYGTTGTDNIGDYLYTPLVSNQGLVLYNYAGSAGLGTANLPNTHIQWESTKKFDAGVELGFLNDRILFNTTFFNNLSTNLLTTINVYAQTGFSSYTGNFAGVIRNRGWEFELSTDNLGKLSPVQWISHINFTLTQNKLIKYDNLANSPDANTLQIGRALVSNVMVEMPYVLLGIDPATGLPKFKDVDGSGTITTADYGINGCWQGSVNPTAYGGITNTVSYKGFSLTVVVQMAHQLMTKWAFYTGLPLGAMWNPCTDVIGNYWKQPGDVKKYPRLYTGQQPSPQNATTNQLLSGYYPYGVSSEEFLGNYWRLKNVQLAYTLPEPMVKKAKMSRVTIYLRGENLAFYTREKLYKDPETDFGNSAPLLKTWTAGAQLSF